MDEQDAFIVLGKQNEWWTSLNTGAAYWRIQCPACGNVHERIVHTHWDKNMHKPVESHQVVCMKTHTTFFITNYPPFVVLHETHFGLTKDTVIPSGDDPIPF